MEKQLGKYSEEAYAVLRIVTGLLFACHGAKKLFGIFHAAGEPVNRIDPLTFMGIGAVLELGLGVLIALGIATGYAAFLASGEMAVAYFMAHFPNGFLPIVNQGELAVVYSFLFLFIATKGAGKWSVSNAESNDFGSGTPFHNPNAGYRGAAAASAMKVPQSAL